MCVVDTWVPFTPENSDLCDCKEVAITSDGGGGWVEFLGFQCPLPVVINDCYSKDAYNVCVAYLCWFVTVLILYSS